jgi:hypothetical protein
VRRGRGLRAGRGIDALRRGLLLCRRHCRVTS